MQYLNINLSRRSLLSRNVWGGRDTLHLCSRQPLLATANISTQIEADLDRSKVGLPKTMKLDRAPKADVAAAQKRHHSGARGSRLRPARNLVLCNPAPGHTQDGGNPD